VHTGYGAKHRNPYCPRRWEFARREAAFVFLVFLVVKKTAGKARRPEDIVSTAFAEISAFSAFEFLSAGSGGWERTARFGTGGGPTANPLSTVTFPVLGRMEED
jgi:hypothetical protein